MAAISDIIASASTAWEDGRAYARKLHTQHSYDPGQVRDAAAYMRELYDTAVERLAFDDGVSAYLFAPRIPELTA